MLSSLIVFQTMLEKIGWDSLINLGGYSKKGTDMKMKRYNHTIPERCDGIWTIKLDIDTVAKES